MNFQGIKYEREETLYGQGQQKSRKELNPLIRALDKPNKVQDNSKFYTATNILSRKSLD